MSVHLLEKHGLTSLRPGRAFPLLRPLDAVVFIAAMLKEGRNFQGVEGFRLLANDKIQPDQEISTDVATFSSEAACLRETFQIIVGRLTDEETAFEVVFS